jgi:ATP-dependent protease HslVU (ClpYQ) peptidase subunit
MTAVVGLVHNGKVWMGADSAFSTTEEVWVQRDSKIFRRGDVLIGTCGEGRYESVMRYLVEIPRLKKGVDPAQWANVDLAYEIRRAHVNDGFVHDSGFFEMEGCEALIGVAGELFIMSADLCAWRPLCGYAAIGSGEGPARSSLHETEKLQPKTRLRRALERAASETTGVRPPFTYEVL